MKNKEVTKFLDEQNHPFRKEIEALRTIILEANDKITENVKWNGPNYGVNSEDRITMRIQPPTKIQLIFHKGAKKQEQPKMHLISYTGKLLLWKENDRAIATFQCMADIENSKSELSSIIKEWITNA
jgi:hypothetical protein